MRDLRLAARALRKAPLYATLATLSLGIAIGANVTVFSVIEGLLFRPLPVPQADRLVRIGRSTPTGYFGTLSFPEYRELHSELARVADVLAYHPNSATLSIAGEPQTAWLELVSGNYFSTLGVSMLAGPGFNRVDSGAVSTQQEDAVMVISHRLWMARFGSKADVIGRVARVNGQNFTIVGIAPAEFHGTFTGFDIDAWVPVTAQPMVVPSAGSLDRRDDRFLMLIARLHTGASMETLRAALDVVSPRLRAEQQDSTRRMRLELARASGVHPLSAGILTTFLGRLQGIVLLVLLIACINLANILLIRASVRERELFVRAALGATRWRLARLVLAESLLLAIAGSALGVALAAAAAWGLQRVPLDVGIPVSLTIALDARVLAAAIALALFTAVAFGAGPALHAARIRALVALRVSGATAGRHGSRLRSVLVAAQVVIATILLTGSMLMVRSIVRSRALDPGFDVAHVMTFAASPDQLGYNEERGRVLWTEILARVRQLPGAESAALALLVPLSNRGDDIAVAPFGATGSPALYAYNYVSPGYFGTVHIRLANGRDFSMSDARHAPDVAIVNETMARDFFGQESALGKTVRVIDGEGRERRTTIIGVVGTIKVRSMGESPRPMLYLPFGQWYRPDMIVHVRTDGRSPNMIRDVTRTMHSLEPDLAVDAQSMAQATAFSLIPLRVAASVLGFAGMVGAALAALGIFGLVGYTVSLRRREIGIRIALGAERLAVTRLVVNEGLRPVITGLCVGLPLAVAGASLLRGLLVGVSATDPVTLVAIALLVAVVAAVASFAPVRRATRLDPAGVLRDE